MVNERAIWGRWGLAVQLGDFALSQGDFQIPVACSSASPAPCLFVLPYIQHNSNRQPCPLARSRRKEAWQNKPRAARLLPSQRAKHRLRQPQRLPARSRHSPRCTMRCTGPPSARGTRSTARCRPRRQSWTSRASSRSCSTGSRRTGSPCPKAAAGPRPSLGRLSLMMTKKGMRMKRGTAMMKTKKRSFLPDASKRWTSASGRCWTSTKAGSSPSSTGAHRG